MTLRLVLGVLALLGHGCLLILVLNTVHGLRFNSRWLNVISLVAFVLGGLAGVAFLAWLLPHPLGDWPIWAIALLTPGLVTSIVGLPVVTIARQVRRLPFTEARTTTYHPAPSPAQEPDWIGHGWRSWLLRLPHNESLALHVEDWDLALPHHPPALDGLKLAIVADLHFTRAYGRAAFERRIEALAVGEPDLILFLGDLADDPACLDWVGPVLGRLRGRLGQFAVLGNHDYLTDPQPVADGLAGAGYEVLGGRWTTVEHRGQTLAIGGTTAPWGPLPDPQRRPEAAATLLLSHSPDQVYLAARWGVDLMFSGHNHGGQVRLPVVGPILMPSRYSRRFEWGFYREGPTLLYVSRGLGAEIPLRYGCPPELTRIRIRIPSSQ